MEKRRRGRNESERLFEAYLETNGYRDWAFEPDIPGQRKPPDYRLRWQGSDLFFEVKELHHQPHRRYRWPRNMISKAWGKFANLADFPCSLVLRDTQGNPPEDLRPKAVFAAMCGDLSITGMWDPVSESVDLSTMCAMFGKHGKMLDESGKPRNTRFSAILVLEHYHVQDPAYILALREEMFRHRADLAQPSDSRDFGRAIEGVFSAAERRASPDLRQVPRVIVCENRDAARPLPSGLFTGPLDERWVLLPEQRMKRTFVGSLRRQIEEAQAWTGLSAGSGPL